jgi:uncharacterized protein YjbI with pentapeptide repeats
MAKKQQQVLNRLAGKRVMFQGKFGYEEGALKARAAAYGATVAKTLNSSIDYLVFPDATSGKTARQQANSLIAKGAGIQVIDVDAFVKLVQPTDDDLLALMRAGGKESAQAFRAVRGGVYSHSISGTKDRPQHAFAGENFDGLDLSAFDFDAISFEKCSFVGAKLDGTNFDVTRDCDFSRATGKSPTFKDAEGSRFVGASFKGAEFEGSFQNADFTDADLGESTFNPYHVAGRRSGRAQKGTFAGAVFRNAKLPKISADDIVLLSPDFGGADLTSAELQDTELKSANLKGASLKDAVLFECKVTDSDLEKADLRGANLADADLSGSKFAGADLTGANLRGAKLDRADLAKAKGYEANKAAGGKIGTSLKEMDAVAKKAKRLEVTFRLEGPGDDEASVGGSSSYGYHARVPYTMSLNLWKRTGSGKQAFSDAMMILANALGHRAVRFDTVKATATKASKGSKELHELAMNAIVEAFAQPLPDAGKLAEATKAYRAKENKKNEAQKKRYAAARAKEEKKREEAKAKALAELKEKAGDVNDFDSFMKAIVVRTDKDKVKKATKMLKAERFQLFNDIAETHVLGVVKSQTDPDLVYACRIDGEGHYACCTQNLNICGGLRGSVCKHLLVLIIGLVKAGQLDPGTIDGWVSRTHGGKPELNKETMGEIFIKYKGAEAGDVDWRPTETVPEDYYAL